jgi:cell division septation protein DedD
VNDTSEATHYQIELTSRQVLAGLVVLLVCLFAAFFAGVWIGRNAEASSAASELASVDEVARGGERYDFFSKTGGERSGGGDGAGATAAEEDSSLDAFPSRSSSPLEGDFGPDAEDEELGATEGERSTMAGADPDALFEDDAATAGDADLPPPEEMGRGGRRRRAAARAAEEEALAATADDPELPDDGAPAPPAANRNTSAATSARPATGAGSGFHIQVLATADKAKADALVKRLADADFEAVLVPSNEGGRTLYRVRVGPFSDRPIAAAAAKELETRWGLDSWISPGAP